MGNMNTTRRRYALLGALGLTVALLSGCETWTSGMTLPSPRYLDHPPQYFTPSPPFPLSNELAQQQRTWAAPSPDAVNGGGLPPQVPAGPVPVPQ
jgi:hypothetical protein